MPLGPLVNAYTSDGRIVLVGRDDVIDEKAPDYFYVRRHELQRLPPDFRRRSEDSGGRYSRVWWPDGEARGGFRGRLSYYVENVLKPARVFALEGDVDPVTRFLIENPRVEFATDWRLLWYDLETEKIDDWDRPWQSRILSFSWRSSNGGHGHVRAEARTDKAERRVLEIFARIADRHDILIAWNGSAFDDRVVSGRAQLLDVDLDRRSYHWIDALKLFRRYYTRGDDGAVTSSFALDSVAEAFLGTERKVPLEKRATELGWDGRSNAIEWVWDRSPPLLREYNDQDVTLMELLEQRTGFLALHLALCRLCRVLPGARSLFPMSLVDGKMLQRGYEVGYHFPSRFSEVDSDEGQAQGAYVPEALVGIHESVAVLDYARMYPSIIRTFNMSIETLDDEGELVVPATDAEGRPTGETLARFRAKPIGHLPAALGDIIAERKQYSRQQDAAEPGSPQWQDYGRLSTACKVLANTFYGVVLSPMSRFHVKEIGESVTAMGRRLLRETIDTAQARGLTVVFGDTDSVAPIATDEEAAALRDEMNERRIPALLAELGAPPGEISIEYEKRFARVLVTASKRYAGRWAVHKGRPAAPDSPIDIRGLEIVRSDVNRLARSLQRLVVERIIDGADQREIFGLVRKERERFMTESVELDLLVLAKRVNKPMSEYRSDSPQLRVARWMIENGYEVAIGQKIPYLVLKSGDEVHPSRVDSIDQIDRRTYWNDHIYPATCRVLEAAWSERVWTSLNVSKREAAGQMTMFGQGEEDDAPSAPLLLEVVLPDSDAPWDIDGFRELVGQFPGSLRVRLRFVYPDAEVDVDLPSSMRVRSPIEDRRFMAVLRGFGARPKGLTTLVG